MEYSCQIQVSDYDDKNHYQTVRSRSSRFLKINGIDNSGNSIMYCSGDEYQFYRFKTDDKNLWNEFKKIIID